MTKKILAILVAAFMMVGVLAAVVAANTDSDADYSFFPDCEICENCWDCMEFIFTYYDAYVVSMHATSSTIFFANDADFWSYRDALDDMDFDTNLELIRFVAALTEQYVLPEAIAPFVELWRTGFLAEIYDLPAAVNPILALMNQGDFEQAMTAVVALNDSLVAELAEDGIDVPQWLRSTPVAAPVCPVDPNATVCLCDDVTTTAPQETTTVADTTVNDETTTAADTTVPEETTTVADTTVEETTTVADTTVNGETTTVADTTVNGETTTEAETTTAPPAEGGGTNWGSIAGIIGIVVLVIVNLVAIFGFVRILFNA